MKKVYLKSRIAALITEYIEHMQKDLCLNYRVEKTILYAFDNYCVDNGLEDSMLTEESIESYARSGRVTLPQSGKRYRVLYNFYEYRRAQDPSLEPIHPQRIDAKRHRHTCYIYTDEDIARMMDYPNRQPMWNKELGTRWQLWIGLLVTTGCRVGELVNLKMGDVDRDGCVLTIRETKFRKSRLLPVDKTVIEAIERYIPMRTNPTSPYLFTSRKSEKWQSGTMNGLFNKAIHALKIGENAVNKPRIHDFRHTFAVRKVVEWNRMGIDVQSMMNVLSTYMGHAHYDDTTYYLESSSEILRSAAERFALIKEV